jgi:hypothetical protein
MEIQLKRLELISDINALMKLKETLKNHVMDPLMNWKERMELYHSIQEINNRIRELNKGLH